MVHVKIDWDAMLMVFSVAIDCTIVTSIDVIDHEGCQGIMIDISVKISFFGCFFLEEATKKVKLDEVSQNGSGFDG